MAEAEAVVIRKDGQTIVNLSGIDTNNGGTTGIIGRVRVMQWNGMGTLWLDDYYICDDTGGVNNDCLGDVRIDTLRPTADGATNNFTTSAGSGANYLMVDDLQVPDDNTTYNYSNTAGHIDLYAMENISHNPDVIYAVQVCATVTRTDGAAREVQLKIDAGDVGSAVALSDVYVPYCGIDQGSWTQTSVNAIEAGVEITA